VIVGPGGTGKGALVQKLVEQDPQLWLSRSWTTRPRRPNEPEQAYVWVDRARFEDARSAGAFLETNEFLGQLYGTPVPAPPAGRDLVLEIDVNGAEQVRSRHPDAVVVLLVPPSESEQLARLSGRGEDPDAARARLELGRQEVARGRRLADHEVVNDDLERAVAEVAGIIARRRAGSP